MATKVGDLYFESGIKTAGFDRDAKRMENRIGQSTKKIQGMGGKMGKGFSSAFISSGINPMVGGVAAVGAAIGAVGKQAHDFAKEFNGAMLEVQTISGAVQTDFEGMKQGVLDISFLPIKDGAVQLTEALYQIVSAGHDGADGLKVLEAAAKAATGGVTTTETAADGLTTVLNAWGLEAERVNEVSDVMFTTVKLGKTTFGEISSSISQVAPLASSMGVSFEEVFAAVASLTKQGTPTAQAMTQIRSSLVNMNNALGEGWSDQMTYQEGLQKIAEKAGGSQIELKKLIPDIEGMNAVLGMTGEKAAGAAKDLENTFNSADAANDAFEIMAQKTDVLKQQTFNKWNAQLEEMGGLLLQAENKMYSFLSAALTGADTLGDEFAEIGEKVDGFSERMKVMRNEGVGVVGSMINAALYSDEKVQKIVDSEKAEVQQTKDNIAAIQEEFNRLQESGASDEQLNEFKENLKTRYAEMLEATEKEASAAEKKVKRANLINVATLGMGTYGADLAKTKFKDKKDEVDSYKQIVNAVANLGVEAEKEVDNAINNTTDNINEKTKGVIKTLEEELKDLQDKTGTFTNPEQEASNLEAIKAKTLELKDAWSEVREHYARSMHMDGANEKAKGIEVKSISSFDPKPIKDSLAPMKKLTKEEEKQLKATKEKLDAEREIEMKRTVQRENMAELADNLMIQVNAFDALAQIAGSFNTELGESVKSMADMMYSTANLITNISTGNWLGAVGSGVDLITQMINSSRDNEREMEQAQIERTNRLIETQNKLMQMQTGEDWWKSANKEVDRLNGIIEEAHSKLRTLAMWQFSDINWMEVPMSTQEWLDYIDKHNGSVKDYSGRDRTDEVLEYVNQWADAAEAVRELEAELWNETFGFSSEDITTNIVTGIMDGLELSQDGLGDYFDGFQSLMEKAATKAMTKTFNEKYLQGIQDKFEIAMSDGVISDEEMKALQYDYKNSIRQMQWAAEEWAHVIGEQAEEAEAEKEEGMKGDIKGITEKTAGQLEGRINSIQMNVIGLKEIGQSQLQTLEAIRQNTSYNFHLEELVNMSSDLRVMRQRQNELISSITDSNNGGVTI